MSFDLEQAIREFCDQISVARSLDESIRREMGSHLREKVDHYLNKRQLTEQEAFVLATSALGDPARIVGQLRRVHRADRAADRAFGLLSVFGMLMFIHAMANALFHWGSSHWIVRFHDPAWFGMFQNILLLICYAAPIGCVWLFGKAMKGQGRGRLAEWTRHRATFLKTVCFLITSGLLANCVLVAHFPGTPGYISSVATGGPGAMVVVGLDSPGFRRMFFAQTYLSAGVLAYLACWLASFGGKPVSHDLKAALTALGCAMTLLAISLAHITVFANTGAAAYSAGMLTLSVARIALLSATACLGGWGVFVWRDRGLLVLNP